MFSRKMFVYARMLVVVCLLQACVLSGYAQLPSLSALKNKLQKTGPDTGRVNALLQIGAYYNNIPKPSPADIKSALAYARAAENLSVTLNYPKGLGNSYMVYAQAYRFKQDSAASNGNTRKALALFLKNQLYRDAAEAYLKMEEYFQAFGNGDLNVRIGYYQQALTLFARVHAINRQAATLKILADFYQLQGQTGKALTYLKQAQALYGPNNLQELEGLYDLLGSVNAIAGDLNEALKYGLLAIKTATQLKDSSLTLCTIYNRVGLTYYKLNQYKQAQDLFNKSLAIAVRCKYDPSIITLSVNLCKLFIAAHQYPAAIAALKKIEVRYAQYNDPALDAGLDLHFLKCYTLLKQFDTAADYARQLAAVSAKLDQNDASQEAYQQTLAMYYVTTVQDAAARLHLSKFKALATAHHNRLTLSYAYWDEARLDSAEGKHGDAYKNYRKYSILTDSIYNEEQSRQIAQLQVQFETEKKDQELKTRAARITLLNSQAKLQQTNLRQEKTTQKLIIGGALLLAILLIISYSGYRSKQRVNRQLQAQRAEIEQKNRSLTALVHDKDNLLLEKEWLMKEIHHRVKNNLQIVISLLNTQSNYLDNDIAYNAIRESQHRMQSISLIHQKLYQSDNLALVDIHSYITDLVVYLRDSFDTGNRITFALDIVDAEFDVTRSVPLGLILNEAITNAIKYAFPDGRKGTISISLTQGDAKSFALKVHDDGIGFPATGDIAKNKSLGMSLMRGLSKQLGGSLKIESGEGITIAVDFINETLLKAV